MRLMCHRVSWPALVRGETVAGLVTDPAVCRIGESPISEVEVPEYALAALWIVVTVLFGLLTGTAAGWLSWLDERRVPRAVLIGGSACGATWVFAVAVTALFA
jgi:hypothetical protein